MLQMRKFNALWAGIVVAISFTGETGAANLQSADITRIYNRVEVLKPGSQAKPAAVNDTVTGAEAVRTGAQSRAELMFTDKTLTRLGANTVFTFQQGTRDMELNGGTMLLQVPKNVGGAQIRTAAVTAAVTGTTVLVEYTTQQNGYCKFTVLEGTMRLFLKDRPGESILLEPGDMIIMRPNARRIPDPVKIDLKKLIATSRLLNGFADTENEEELAEAIQEQEKEIKDGNLLDTNIILIGKGNRAHFANDELLDLLDERFSQGESQFVAQFSLTPPAFSDPTPIPLAPTPIPSPAPTPNPNPTPVPTPIPPEKFLIPDTIAGSPYIIDGATTVITDPFIVRNGVTVSGGIIDPTNIPPATLFPMASTNTTLFDDQFALFKFDSLEIRETFMVDTVGGPTRLLLEAANGLDVTGPVDLTGTNLTALGLFNQSGSLHLQSGSAFDLASGQLLQINSNDTSEPLLLNASIFGSGDLMAATAADLYVGIDPATMNPLTPLPILEADQIFFESVGDQMIASNILATDLSANSTGGDIIFGTNSSQFSIQNLSLTGQNVQLGGTFAVTNLLANAAVEIRIEDLNSSSFGFANLTAPTISVNTMDPINADILRLATDQIVVPTGYQFAPNTFILESPNTNYDLNELPLDLSAVTSVDLNVAGVTNIADFFFDLQGGSNSYNLALGAGGLQASFYDVGEFNRISVASGGDVEAGDLTTRELNMANGDVFVGRLFADNVDVQGDASMQELSEFLGAGTYHFSGTLNVGDGEGGGGIFINNGSLEADAIDLDTGDLTASTVTTLGNSTSGDVTDGGVIQVDAIYVAGNLEAGRVESGSDISASEIDVNDILIGNRVEAEDNINAVTIKPLFASTNTFTIIVRDQDSGSPSVQNGIDFSGTDYIDPANPATDGMSVEIRAPEVHVAPTPLYGDGTIGGILAKGGGDLVSNNPGDGGTISIESGGQVLVEMGATISADQGVAATPPPAGNGGQVNIETDDDGITVYGTVSASSPGANMGGIIELIAKNSSSVEIGSSGLLRAAMAAGGSGPGGRIMIQVDGDDGGDGSPTNIAGTLTANNGEIEITSGASIGIEGEPSINIGNTAQLTADTVKVGALAIDGVLNIRGGATISADTQAMLYAGTGSDGAINFTGGGNVTLATPDAILRAHTVFVQSGMNVLVGTNNAGVNPDMIGIFAADHLYGDGMSYGNIQLNGNPIDPNGTLPSNVTVGPVSAAPPF